MEEHEILRSWRVGLGIRQPALASQLGIKQPYMSQLELGRRPITDELLARMPPAIREPLVRARIAELRKLIVTDHLGRDEKDFAIEHAGYLVDSIERFLNGNDGLSAINPENWRELHTRVYEFRQRRAKVAELEKLL